MSAPSAPGADAFLFRSSAALASAYLFDFIPESGRVLVHPVYSGIYERWEPFQDSPSTRRNRVIRWAQDIGRTIDYLETRPDIDGERIAYYAFSMGLSWLRPRVRPKRSEPPVPCEGERADEPAPEDHCSARARSQALALQELGRYDDAAPDGRVAWTE